MSNRLRRINNSAIAGVCGGFAYWLSIPTWIVRVVWILFTLAGGAGIIIYFLLALLMPRWKEDPLDYKDICC